MKSIQEVLPDRPIDSPWFSGSGYGKDMVPILGAAAVVALVVGSWAVFIRKRRSAPYALGRSPDKPRRKRRSRRSTGQHRNPTLAQTGGLPPLRDDQRSEA